MRGTLGISSVRLFSGESPRQWPSSLNCQQPPLPGLGLPHGKAEWQDKSSQPPLTQVPIAQQQLHSILQNTEIVFLNINSVFLIEGFYYLLHMSSILGGIKLEQLKEKKKKRRNRKRKEEKGKGNRKRKKKKGRKEKRKEREKSMGMCGDHY